MRSSHATTTTRRRLAAATATGLIAGVSLLATPAIAVSAAVPYSCTITELPGRTYEFNAVHDTDADASMTVGQTKAITGTSTVTIPDDLRGAARGVLMATKVVGTAVLKSSQGDINATIPVTPIPAASGTFDIKASGSAGTLAPTAPGTINLTAGAFSALLDFQDDSGASKFKATVVCGVKDGSTPTVDTVNVVAAGQPTPTPTPAAKVATTTKLTAKHAAATGKATIKATVKAADSSSTAGKITLVLKKGSKKIKTVTTSVSASGAAKAVFKKVKAAGKYTVTSSFAGSATTNASTSKVTFKVK